MVIRVADRGGTARRLFWAAVLLALLTGGCTADPLRPGASSVLPPGPGTAASSTAPATGRETTVTSLPPLTSPHVTVVVDDSRLVDHHKGDQPFGPATFAVWGQNVTVDDELGARLVTYHHDRRVFSVKRPSDCCIDLRVEADHYWTLGVTSVSEYTKAKDATSLKLLKHAPLAAGPGVQWSTGKLERDGASLIAFPDLGSPLLVSGPGPLPTLGTTAVVAAQQVRIDNPGFSAVIDTHPQPYEPQFLTRHGDSVYYLLSENTDQNAGYVYQFTGSGELVRTYTTAPSRAVTPARWLLISDDGAVYQMTISQRTVRVLRISPNPG